MPLGFDTGARFDGPAIRDTLIPAMLARETDSDALPLSGYTPRNLFARSAVGGIRFRPDIRSAEDLLFICEVMLRCRAAVAVDEAYYQYRFHGGSVTKRYSPHVPASHDLSNDALEALLSPYPACMARMPIRRRKMAVTAVRNFCLTGTPYGPAARVGRIREYMNRADVRAWFADVRPSQYPLRLRIKLALMKQRMALTSALLYSTLFNRF